jgi:hypothetical protein
MADMHIQTMESFDNNLLHVYKLRRARGADTVFDVLKDRLREEFRVSESADQIRETIQDFMTEHHVTSSTLEIASLIYACRIEVFEAPGALVRVYSPFQGYIRGTIRIAFVDGLYYGLDYTNSVYPPEQLSYIMSKLHL